MRKNPKQFGEFRKLSFRVNNSLMRTFLNRFRSQIDHPRKSKRSALTKIGWASNDHDHLASATSPSAVGDHLGLDRQPALLVGPHPCQDPAYFFASPSLPLSSSTSCSSNHSSSSWSSVSRFRRQRSALPRASPAYRVRQRPVSGPRVSRFGMTIGGQYSVADRLRTWAPLVRNHNNKFVWFSLVVQFTDYE